MDNTHGERVTSAWKLRHHWLVAIAFGLIPVLLTAIGSAAAQIAHADDASSAVIIAGAVGVSATVGLMVMKVSPVSFPQYGFRFPRGARAVWWFLPVPITVIIAVVTQGVHLPGSAIAAYALLTIVVAVNEEVWFRGVILSVLRSGGARVAVVGSSVMFGVLHLSNLAGGESLEAGILQLVFAVLFGIVAAELTVVTGSLWPAIGWHAAWDFANYVGGNAADGAALIGVGVVCAVMLVYAVALWGRVRQTQG